MKSKYKRWHDAIIERAKSRQLVDGEYHHIKPRSLGGSNDWSNIVRLTFREHFLVHWLLTKILVGDAHRRMCFAFHRITFSRSENNGHRNLTSLHYEVARRKFNQAISRHLTGIVRSAETIEKLRRPKSVQHRNALSEARKGKPNFKLRGRKFSLEHREALSKSRKGKPNLKLRGQKKSLDHRRALSDGHKQTEKLLCPHCGTCSNPGNMRRWHFDNCRGRIEPRPCEYCNELFVPKNMKYGRYCSYLCRNTANAQYRNNSLSEKFRDGRR